MVCVCLRGREVCSSIQWKQYSSVVHWILSVVCIFLCRSAQHTAVSECLVEWCQHSIHLILLLCPHWSNKGPLCHYTPYANIVSSVENIWAATGNHIIMISNYFSYTGVACFLVGFPWGFPWLSNCALPKISPLHYSTLMHWNETRYWAVSHSHAAILWFQWFRLTYSNMCTCPPHTSWVYTLLSGL